MELRFKQRNTRVRLALCGLIFFLCLGLTALLSASPPPEAAPILGRADGYAVRRGAPAGGQTIAISRETLLRGTLMLVSPRHPLPADFPPPNTRSIRAMVGSYLPVAGDAALCREAVYALCELETAHPLTGAAWLENGAISAAQQEDLRREAFDRYRKVYPLNEALRQANAAVPGGGESEHQLGWSIDLRLTGPLSLGQTDALMRTEEGKWLAENLWRYGFIRRYGADEAREEGACEAIHLRYVGPLHAAAMHALNVTLEEYLALLRKEGAVTLLRDDQPVAYLICAPCEGDWHVSLPEGVSAQFSGDNTGWAVALIETPRIYTKSSLK